MTGVMSQDLRAGCFTSCVRRINISWQSLALQMWYLRFIAFSGEELGTNTGISDPLLAVANRPWTLL